MKIASINLSKTNCWLLGLPLSRTSLMLQMCTDPQHAPVGYSSLPSAASAQIYRGRSRLVDAQGLKRLAAILLKGPKVAGFEFIPFLP